MQPANTPEPNEPDNRHEHTQEKSGDDESVLAILGGLFLAIGAIVLLFNGYPVTGLSFGAFAALLFSRAEEFRKPPHRHDTSKGTED